MSVFKATSRIVGVLLALIGVWMTPAQAVPILQLDVTYTSGNIISGPLSFGLTTLPNDVTVTFVLNEGIPNPEPGGGILYTLTEVHSAHAAFGDATASSLASFTMITQAGLVTSLTYRFLPTPCLPYCNSLEVMNFPLRIIGTDIASGEDFEYIYDESVEMFSDYVPPEPEPTPEPTALLLSLVGLAGIAGVRRRRTP